MKRILGSTLLIAVLAGGILLAMQMWQPTEQAAADSPRGGPIKILEFVRDEGNGPVTVKLTIEPSPDLPQEMPAAVGVLLGQEGDTIAIGTGNIELDVEVEITDGEPQTTVSLSHDGPEKQVVISPDAQIFEDVTDIDSLTQGATEDADITLTQAIQPVEAFTVSGDVELQVWGQVQGDIIVADVVVYEIVEENF